MMNMAGYLIITNVGMNGPYLLQGPSESGVKGGQWQPPPPSKNVAYRRDTWFLKIVSTW